MKTYTYALLAAAAATGMALGQTAYTTPVGYVTQTAAAGQFNLLGLTVQEPVVASGDFETVAGTTLTDSDVNFTTLLTAGSTYVLEITNGAGNGVIQEVVAWSGSDLTTPQDISSSVIADSTTYKLRKSATISSVFGANNEAGLKAGTSTTADIVWVPNASNGFDQYYRAVAAPPFVSAGWKRIGGGDVNFGNAPIVYADSFIVQRREVTPLTLTISGEVKTKPSATVLAAGAFNYIGGIYPAGSTLENSGLQATVLAGTSTSADVVWIPQGNGTYLQYYYATAQPPFVSAGWKQIGGGDTNRGAIPLTPGIIVQRKGTTATVTLTPPPSYSTL